MANTAVEVSQPGISFGRVTQDGDVRLMEFCPDPDGGPNIWYRPTGDRKNIAARAVVSFAQMHDEGRCDDTAEYWSPAGANLQSLLRNTPEGAELAVFKLESGVGTRTWREDLEVQYYGGLPPIHWRADDHTLALEAQRSSE